MKLLAIIPVRKGSVRVSEKNTRPFHHTTLLHNKINQLKQLLNESVIDGIVVNTNCPKAIEIAVERRVPFMKRDEYYASSECPSNEFFRHIASKADSQYTDLIYAPVTSPLISLETFKSIINMYKTLDKTLYDSIATVTERKEHLWLEHKPLNYEWESHPRSQDLPNIVALNYACCIISRTHQIEYGNVIGKHPHFVSLSAEEGWDIDTVTEFEMGELLYASRRSRDVVDFENIPLLFSKVCASAEWTSLKDAFRVAERVYLVGHGGNLAIADHGAIDIAKLTSKCVIAPGSGILTTSLISMHGYDSWIREWLKLQRLDKKSMVIALTSTSSDSFLKGLEYASEQGCSTFIVSPTKKKTSFSTLVHIDCVYYHSGEIVSLMLMYQLVHSLGIHPPRIGSVSSVSSAVSSAVSGK
jgi:CMP-N-acetylneuraminic acid synthetase